MLSAFTPSIQAPLWLNSGLRLKRPLVQLALLFALSLALLPGDQAQADDNKAVESRAVSLNAVTLAQQATSTTPAFPAPGRYLFGQAAERDQLGQGYIILESTGEQVFGALYYPSSSFDCFQGQVDAGQLAMSITNSYTQETYPYSIALVSDTAVASTANGSLEPLNLQGFHQIDAINDNDLRLLETCRAVVNPEV